MSGQLAGVKSVLCIAAHYDDEALFFGGTLLELARRGAEIHIGVLTDVKHCNPPKNAEQQAKDHLRQRMRLGAFARVCQDLGAQSHHAHLGQIADAKDPASVRRDALDFLVGLFDTRIETRQPGFDLQITHGSDGDYSDERYAKGYETARAQHVLCNEIAREVGTGWCPVWEHHPEGDIIIPALPAGRLALLDYYRYGCTQADEWPAEKWYPEFASANEERYKCR